MSTTGTLRAAARELSLALALAAVLGVAACADTAIGPRDDDAGTRALEPTEPRLDGGDTTSVYRCDHTQPWGC